MAFTSIKNAIGWPTTNSILRQQNVFTAKDIYSQEAMLTDPSIYATPSQVNIVPHHISESGRLRMINMRLRNTHEQELPKGLQDLHTSLCGDIIFVFIVAKGKPITLDDDASMFPSDTLITQLRLLMD